MVDSFLLGIFFCRYLIEIHLASFSVIGMPDFVTQGVELTSLPFGSLCSAKLVMFVDVFGEPMNSVFDRFQDELDVSIIQ